MGAVCCAICVGNIFSLQRNYFRHPHIEKALAIKIILKMVCNAKGVKNPFQVQLHIALRVVNHPAKLIRMNPLSIPNSPHQIFEWLFYPIGLGCIVYSVMVYINTRKFLSDCIRADGKVIDLVRSTDQGTGVNRFVSYAPVFEFTDRNGQSHKVTSDESSSLASFSIGQQVVVLYEPDKPMQARINTFMQIWGGSIIFGIVGTSFILFDCFFAR